MTYQLFHRRSSFCRCALEAWVQIGVMCERKTFYGADGEAVRAKAMRWVRDKIWLAACGMTTLYDSSEIAPQRPFNFDFMRSSNELIHSDGSAFRPVSRESRLATPSKRSVPKSAGGLLA
jgi:hypothetical protein